MKRRLGWILTAGLTLLLLGCRTPQPRPLLELNGLLRQSVNSRRAPDLGQRWLVSLGERGGRDPVRVSLSPDARQLALQVADQGRWRVELLDLSDLLEPDRPAGSGLTTPPLEPER